MNDLPQPLLGEFAKLRQAGSKEYNRLNDESYVRGEIMKKLVPSFSMQKRYGLKLQYVAGE